MSRRWLFQFSVICVCASGSSLAQALPTFETVRSQYRTSDSILQDRNGEILHELRTDRRVRRLTWVPLAKISHNLVRAVLLAEDRRFYQHPGVDPLALSSALIGRLKGQRLRGASTIPMQLASALFAKDMKISRGLEKKSIWQKSLEIFQSLYLSAMWSKAEILEAYLNLVYYRGELQGLSAASQGLFRLQPHALNEEESAVLAALIRSPNAAISDVSERACRVLKAMAASADCVGLEYAVRATLGSPYRLVDLADSAPHVANLLREELARTKDPLITTLDVNLQKFAAESLRRQLLSLQSQNMRDGAVLVLDNTSGEVLAYVGNSGTTSTARHVDGIRAQRQAGSTLKPFLYGKAIESRLMTAATLLDDSPLEISLDTGNYEPQNYDRRFKSFVSVRVALASSLNIPAVRALEILGVEKFVQTLADFGVVLPQRPDFYGPSLALGSGDVTLWDLTNAYRALANGGVWSTSRFLLKSDTERSPRRALSKAAAFVIQNILSDRDSRSITFGLDNSLSTSYWTAVKTGTSKDMRDNWCIGFSERYTVGVWTGNFSGDPMWHVSGVEGAAPVWLEVMNFLHSHKESRPPEPPAEVVNAEVYYPATGQKRVESFLKGTEPNHLALLPEEHVETRITYPVQGTLIAVDPRIAKAFSKVYFRVKNPKPGDVLSLNGKPLHFPVKEYTLWTPQPGFYRLTLKDRDQNKLDEVTFTVRGRTLATR